MPTFVTSNTQQPARLYAKTVFVAMSWENRSPFTPLWLCLNLHAVWINLCLNLQLQIGDFLRHATLGTLRGWVKAPPAVGCTTSDFKETPTLAGSTVACQ